MLQFILGAIGVVLISEATKPKKMAKGGEMSIGSQTIGGKKMYFLYDENTGKRKGLFKTKKEAESHLMANGGEVRRVVIEEDDYEDDYDEEDVYKENYGDKYDFIDVNELKKGGQIGFGEYRVMGELMFIDSSDSLNVDKYVVAYSENDAIKKVKRMYLNAAPDSDVFAELVDSYE